MPYNPDAMSRTSAPRSQLPPIDERLVMPGSRAEILEGRVLMSPGAHPPHATRHLTLAYLLGAHVAPGFVAALDMLTRTSEISDFAPDASVYPAGADPETGGRRLEVLAFEIVSEQPLAVPTRKARQLVGRGVERVIALVLAKNRALEWDGRLGRWRHLHLDERITHPCFEPSLPVRALLETARADEAVLAALESRRPDLVARIEARGEARGELAGEARGRLSGAREAVRLVCEVLGIPVTAARARQIQAADLASLSGLLETLRRERRWPSARRRR